jgi:hypothetical protein
MLKLRRGTTKLTHLHGMVRGSSLPTSPLRTTLRAQSLITSRSGQLKRASHVLGRYHLLLDGCDVKLADCESLV